MKRKTREQADGGIVITVRLDREEYSLWRFFREMERIRGEK